VWDRACAAVGSALAQPEVVAVLMPAVLGKWESLRDDERALIPCTECLSALVGALGPQFLPFVEPLYGRIMRLVHARTAALATPELEEPDFDWPCVSLDLLSAMLESFGPQMAPLLESSGGVALIVQAAGIDPETEMKRVLFACLGDLAKNCWELLAPHAQALLPMLLHHFNPFCEPPRTACTLFIGRRSASVRADIAACNNATWAVGEIVSRLGAEGADTAFLGSVVAKIESWLKEPRRYHKTILDSSSVALARCAQAANTLPC